MCSDLTPGSPLWQHTVKSRIVWKFSPSERESTLSRNLLFWTVAMLDLWFWKLVLTFSRRLRQLVHKEYLEHRACFTGLIYRHLARWTVRTSVVWCCGGVLCGVVWHGVAWCGVVCLWCCVACCGVVLCGVVWHVVLCCVCVVFPTVMSEWGFNMFIILIISFILLKFFVVYFWHALCELVSITINTSHFKSVQDITVCCKSESHTMIVMCLSLIIHCYFPIPASSFFYYNRKTITVLTAAQKYRFYLVLFQPGTSGWLSIP